MLELVKFSAEQQPYVETIVLAGYRGTDTL